MRVAVVAPSPVPFTNGGMERLVWGMVSKINELTRHQADLIKLPLREQDFWGLIGSYRSFHRLDLSHFDMVISTKYPSWMVSHPNHVLYMVHKLRGLYDTYHLTGLPEAVSTGSPHTRRLLGFLEKTRNAPDIEAFWDEFDEYQAHKDDIPPADTAFPGPLIRKIVHYLDSYALNPSRIKRYCSMSRTVYARTGYFPSNVPVDVIYPPPSNNGIGEHSYDNFFFTVSRLDGAKRVSLLIEAMRRVKGDARLVIAGTGPDEDALRDLARGDDRIELRGFCSDEEVASLYANCLGVLYAPYEEDYGLVTVEAFLRHKPVITCSDSGGPLELIVDGESGYITPPAPDSLAGAIQKICDDPRSARRMGDAGYAKARDLTWENFIGVLLPGSIKNASHPPRKKVIVLATFPIFPPRGGGQVRIYNLYKNLAKCYDVEILSFTRSDQASLNANIAPGLREIRFPESKPHSEEEAKIERSTGMPVSDVAMPRLSHLTEEFGAALREKAPDADLIVVSHPYLYDEAARVKTEARIVYEAHNVEYDLKSRYLPKSASDLLDDVYRVEKLCCEKSELVMACTGNDAKRLAELYGISPGKIVIVPNGIDTGDTPFVPRAGRVKNKAEAGLENETLALFMGSWHPPNLEACREVFKLAEMLPGIKFLLMGSQCQAFQYDRLPKNVGLLGVVDEQEKSYIFSIVDVALNPMRRGSGTNLKMFDYMAAGIPVVSTTYGARGIEDADQCVYLADGLEDMARAILDAVKGNGVSRQAKARQVVESAYDWRVISENLKKRLDSL